MKSDSFKEFVLDQLRSVNSLVCRTMFGGFGLYAGERFFGLIFEGRFYLKTSPATRGQFERAGMNCFQPKPNQKLGAYYEVPPDVVENSTELARWVRDAIKAAAAS